MTAVFRSSTSPILPNPHLVGSVNPAGIQKGVDVDVLRSIAVLASGTSGLHVVSIANPASPALIGTLGGGDARDVVLKDTVAFVADFTRSFTTVDLASPSAPVLLASTPLNTGGRLTDVAFAGNFAFGADVLFVNGVPIIDVATPATPLPRATLNFSNFRDDDGQGIAVDGSFVYLAAALGSAFIENGATGNSRLYIGQYPGTGRQGRCRADVEILRPDAGSTFIEGSSLSISANATDDVSVVAVSFSVNGKVMFSDTSAPYEFVLNVPAGSAAVVLGATAVDFGGNVGTAANVTVNVVADPLTTVQGLVVDASGSPVSSATVTCQGIAGSTGPDGRFSIVGVPTTAATVSCVASFVSGATTLTGISAAVAPVQSGVTGVGTIVLRSLASRGRDFWLAYQAQLDCRGPDHRPQ